MYKRIEEIEEENLDWSQSYLNKVEDICEETCAMKDNIIFVPMCKSVKTLLQSVNAFNIEKRLVNFFDKNMALASSLGILLLPYFVGFLIAYALFYNYGGMTIIGFLSIEKDHLIFQLWSIGAYLFVTLWVFWAFSKVVQSNKKLFSL